MPSTKRNNHVFGNVSCTKTMKSNSCKRTKVAVNAVLSEVFCCTKNKKKRDSVTPKNGWSLTVFLRYHLVDIVLILIRILTTKCLNSHQVITWY